MKWGVIKHDVAKFYGVYKFVLQLNQYQMALKDVLNPALNLYKVKHPKHQVFISIHYWCLLKDILGWANFPNHLAYHQAIHNPSSMPKKKTLPRQTMCSGEIEENLLANGVEAEEISEALFSKLSN